MNILYIFGIAILLTSGTDSLNEDAKTDNLQQRILLRKLQNFQETQPTTWNKVLANVLVNKIRIFSFTSQDKENEIKNDAPVSKENTILTDFFSKVFVVYKKFIYDSFVGKRKTNDSELHITSHKPKSIEDEISKMEPEEMIIPTEVTYAEGPKSEVELVEPKYHGKITQEETTENPGGGISETTENSVSNREDTKIPNYTDTDIKSSKDPDGQKGNVDSGLEESFIICAEGFVKSDSGDCVKNVSRLILAVPNQCPLGYKRDWLGYCRKVFRF